MNYIKEESKKIKQYVRDSIYSINPVDFSITLTIFIIIFYFGIDISEWLVVPMVTIATLAILFKKMREFVTFWVFIVGIFFTYIFLNWQLVDNHIYLWGYWLIAILVSKIWKNNDLLPISGKYLIAFCMSYAVIQKIISPTYTDGSFFYFSILTDQRFNFIGKLIQFDMKSVIAENINQIDVLKSNTESVILNTGPWVLKPISSFLTWYTILVECLLAVIFYLKEKYYYWQHLMLILFCTIYILLPVKGFAFTLLILGFSNVKKEHTTIKSIYLVFILYMFAISTLFRDLIS